MAVFIETNSELDALRKLLFEISVDGKRNGQYRELLYALLVVPFNRTKWREFCKFKDVYIKLSGDRGTKGWNRATRVYTTMQDRTTKPSYLRRLLAYPDTPRNRRVEIINQWEKLKTDFSKKPGLSNLSFVFLRPADLFDQFRPGYVPCPIAGDFKLRDGRLHMSIMFRTMDAFSVGYADLYYLRSLQLSFLKEIQASRKNSRFKNLIPGNLHFFLARTYLHRDTLSRPGTRGSGKRLNKNSLTNTLIAAIDKHLTH